MEYKFSGAGVGAAGQHCAVPRNVRSKFSIILSRVRGSFHKSFILFASHYVSWSCFFLDKPSSNKLFIHYWTKDGWFDNRNRWVWRHSHCSSMLISIFQKLWYICYVRLTVVYMSRLDWIIVGGFGRVKNIWIGLQPLILIEWALPLALKHVFSVSILREKIISSLALSFIIENRCQKSWPILA